MRQVDFTYRPLPIHHDFHKSGAYERALFGAFGSGKTYAIVAEAIAFCLEQPGARGLIARKTIPELRDTTEHVFFDVLPPELREAGEVRRSGGHVSTYTFPNGSQVLFRGLDDWNKHRSLNVAFIAFDEADEFDEETYMGMLSRVRQVDPTAEAKEQGAGKITRRAIWSASNPGGHNWLWKRFIQSKTKVKGTEFFRSTSFDNVYLPPEYLDSLMLYPRHWIERYVLCQFDDFAGQIYDSWNYDQHVVDRIPGTHESEYVMGMDPGTRNPTAGLWCLRDIDGSISGTPRSLIGVAEYEASRMNVEAHAEEWRKLEAVYAPNVKRRIADPNVRTPDRGTNMGLDSQYSRLGFNFENGPKDHADRIPMLGALINAGRFKVTKDCMKTYEAIKDYKWVDLSPMQRANQLNAPEKPQKTNDHLVDCSQYVSSVMLAKPRRNIHREPLTMNDQIHNALRKQQEDRRNQMGNPRNEDGSVL